MRSAISFLLAFFLTFIPLTAAVAADTTVKVGEETITIAAPPWAKGAPADTVSEVHRDQKDNQGVQVFIQEYIPKGESFENWNELYAVMVLDPVGTSLQDSVNLQLNIYSGNCVDVGASLIQSTENAVWFDVFCTAYMDNASKGEFATIAFVLDQGRLIKNYYHLRVPAFTMDELTGGAPRFPVLRKLMAFQAYKDQFHLPKATRH